MKQKVERRRRGAALEDAILAAAWAELLDQGYGGFTMDAVAKRAGTSRPVLARRWDSRADLVVAALRRYREVHPVEAPDLGNVRDELIALLQMFSDRSAQTMVRILLSMNEYFEETHSNLADLRERIIGNSVLEQVLARGVSRGELDPAKLTPGVSTVAVDLARHEIIMTHRAVTPKRIAEIVDTVFLPLVAVSARR